MRKIGYRLKFFKDWEDDFYKQYAFDAVEIKVSESLLQYVDFLKLERLRRYLGNILSFHIPKRTFYADADFELTQKFMTRCLQCTDDYILVTHLMYDIPYNEKYMTQLSSSKAMWRVALENVEMCGDLLGYLATIKQVAKKYAFKVCLDVGHLFYSAFKSEVTIQELLNFFKKDDWWRENIVEFHIHDYDETQCHLNLNRGMICWKDFCELLDILKSFNKAKQPIIIETNVEDISVQGEQEVSFLRERIKEYEDS